MLFRSKDDGTIRVQETIQHTSERFVLTNENIEQKQIQLTKEPIASSVMLIPAGGPPQLPDIDFRTTGQILSWDSLGLDGILDANDILVIYYSWS